MGRKITNGAHQHFTYIQIEDKSVCKLCKDVMKGRHATNLKKHLMRCHNFTKNQVGSVALPNKSSSNQPTVNRTNTIKIEISKEILIDACVELVTVNGRPFSLMEDSGFKKIFEPIRAGFVRKTKDKQFSLSSESIQKYVTREADELKRKIIEEVKNCMVSVKVDGVTRLGHSFLGINIQYTKNGQIVLRTLALKEITSQHTGDNLKRIIIDACNSFQIGIDNIYSITTDNGSNLLKAIKIIASENGEYDVIENEVDSDDQDEFGLFGDNIEIVVEDDPDMEGNTSTGIGLQFGSDAFFEIFYKNFHDFNNDAPSTSTLPNLRLKVTGMSCAARTLQLAIEDSLKQHTRVGKLILEVRRVVKTLRTETFMYMLRKQKLNKPIIDCTTRWGSTFDMFKVLLELKEFCEEMELTNFNEFKNICESDWSKIEEVVCGLEPARKCAKKLQYEQLTIGSFYGCWQECKLATEKIGSSFARTILKNMRDRETKLLDNDVVLAGIFLDPRFKVVLNTDEMERAKSHLKQLWARLLSLRKIATVDAEIEDYDTDTMSVASNSFSDEMEAFLKKKETEHKVEQGIGIPSNSSFMSTKKIEDILNSFQIEQERIRLAKNSTIFQFWETKKEIWPELYMLAQVLLGVPASQFSVERLFSGLKFLLPPTRCNIKKKILEEQLFVRTNRIFEKKEEKILFAVTKNNTTLPQQGSENIKDEEVTDHFPGDDEPQLKGKKRKVMEQQTRKIISKRKIKY